MNKLTEIKSDLDMFGTTTGENQRYLIYLLEEKDKALTEVKDDLYTIIQLNERPSTVESYAQSAIETIDKALNTSSNNEGES